MRLTEKDRELVRLIERWGFMRVEDVCKFQKYKNKNSAVWRLNRLVEHGLIKREKSVLGFFLYMPLSYRGIDIAAFPHDQTVKYLALHLSEEMGCEYLTLRELRSAARVDEGVAGLTKKVPDFILVQSDKRIAIEVELSQKPLKRQRENIDRYLDSLQKQEFVQVFYYCGSYAILERIRQITTENGVSHLIKSTRLPEEIGCE